MNTLNEIAKHLETISEILIDARHLSNDGHQMLLGDNETHIVITRSNFLKRLRGSLYELSVVELAKLFSHKNSNDDYSIFKLLKVLQNNLQQSEWANKINSSEIQDLESALTSPAMDLKVKKLMELRNQHFAHTDKDRDNRIDFYYTDITDLIVTGEGIVNVISTKLLNKPINFSKYEGEDVTTFFKDYKNIIHLAGMYNLSKVAAQ